VFIYRPQTGDGVSSVAAAGFELLPLPAIQAGGVAGSARESWLGVPEARDAEDTIAALGRVRPDWLITDHYGIGTTWERALRSHAERILVIDDLADRAHDCHLLLDQNYFGGATDSRYDALMPGTCDRLLGPRYALLQPAYASVRATLPPRRSGVVARVLVFLGGSDQTNETRKALEALSTPPLMDLAVDVVLGANHPNPEAIHTQIAMRTNATLYRGLPTLAGVMARADLAVGADGATTWERLCLDLPSVVVSVAHHQVPFTEVLSREGYTRWIGHASTATVAAYVDALSAERTRQRPDLPPLVDGLGARRVAEAIMPSPTVESLTIRRPGLHDMGLFFEWRNERTARQFSPSNAPIPWSVHREWFTRKIHDQTCEIAVAEADGLPVGQFRLDDASGEVVLSYSLDPVARGRGWGKWLVAEAMGAAARRAASVRAEVRFDNAPSRRIFTNLGFTEGPEADGTVVFRWSPPSAWVPGYASRGERS
jgi:UDP-2,4-diacetamido-2,4,6-trideoxy-beta-L-altropyranose hydrolase